MSKYTIDSCVLYASYVKEQNTQKSINFLISCLQNKCEIINPNLFYYEIMSNILKYQLGNGIMNHARKFIENITIITPNQHIEHLAIEITKSGNDKSGYPHFYDAMYHATAIINNATFITLDKKHYNKAKHFGNIELI
jgi:predicted nucleic acid-binding protein